MDNLKRLIQLAKADGGKFFVIDENANPQLVIMPIAEYEKVLLKKVQGQIEDIEEINKKILEVQRNAKQTTDQVEDRTARQTAHDELVSEVIDSTFEFEPPMPSPDAQQKAEMEDI